MVAGGAPPALRRPSRFNELRHAIPAVSQKSLSATLRRLERNGIVARHVLSSRPVAVEYRITPLGKTLRNPVDVLLDWAGQHLPAIGRRAGHTTRPSDGAHDRVLAPGDASDEALEADFRVFVPEMAVLVLADLLVPHLLGVVRVRRDPPVGAVAVVVLLVATSQDAHRVQPRNRWCSWPAGNRARSRPAVTSWAAR